MPSIVRLVRWMQMNTKNQRQFNQVRYWYWYSLIINITDVKTLTRINSRFYVR